LRQNRLRCFCSWLKKLEGGRALANPVCRRQVVIRRLSQRRGRVASPVGCRRYKSQLPLRLSPRPPKGLHRLERDGACRKESILVLIPHGSHGSLRHCASPDHVLVIGPVKTCHRRSCPAQCQLSAVPRYLFSRTNLLKCVVPAVICCRYPMRPLSTAPTVTTAHGSHRTISPSYSDSPSPGRVCSCP